MARCPVAYLRRNHRSDPGLVEFARGILEGRVVSCPNVTIEASSKPCATVIQKVHEGFQPLVSTNHMRIRLNKAVQAYDETELPVYVDGVSGTLTTRSDGSCILETPSGSKTLGIDDALARVKVRERGRLVAEGTCIAPESPVIVLKNQADGVVCNGDIGVLESFTNESATISFDGFESTVKFKERPEIALAHVLTVHKSQGGEFDDVVVCIGDVRMWNASLLYTAVTRARSRVHIVGSRADVAAVARAKLPPRRTCLRALLTTCSPAG